MTSSFLRCGGHGGLDRRLKEAKEQGWLGEVAAAQLPLLEEIHANLVDQFPSRRGTIELGRLTQDWIKASLPAQCDAAQHLDSCAL